MVYEYGSPPPPEYNFEMFVRTLAPVLPENDLVFFYNGSLDWRNNLNQIPLALFRNICHWKSPRPFGKVSANGEDDVNRQWQNALQYLNHLPLDDGGIEHALGELVTLNGVEIPMASALLTAWNPNQFGIMDFKTLAVLHMQQGASVQNYLAFRSRLLQLREAYEELQNCGLRQIELAIWHYYPIQKVGERKRADDQ